MQVTAKKRSNAFRKTPGERIFDFINGFILVLLCIVTLYPMWYVIVASFTENSYLVAHPARFSGRWASLSAPMSWLSPIRYW